MSIIGTIIAGLVVGLLARFILPGRQNLSLVIRAGHRRLRRCHQVVHGALTCTRPDSRGGPATRQGPFLLSPALLPSRGPSGG